MSSSLKFKQFSFYIKKKKNKNDDLYIYTTVNGERKKNSILIIGQYQTFSLHLEIVSIPKVN